MLKFVYFFLTTLRMAIISIVISLPLTLLAMLFGYDHGFWRSLLGGALGIFIVWVILSLLKTAIELWRFKIDPLYKEMYLRTGITWKEYIQRRSGL